jgi:hypothetical protein
VRKYIGERRRSLVARQGSANPVNRSARAECRRFPSESLHSDCNPSPGV